MEHINEYKIYDDRQNIMIEQVKSNLDNWLCLYGKSGTGKNAISDLIATQKRNEKKSVINISAFKLLLRFKSDYLNSYNYLEEIGHSDLVIINEIEKFWKGTAEQEKNILFEIINDLYENGGQLIIISNLTWKELQEEGIVTPAIADRFAEKGTKIEFNWDSYRQRKEKK